jgi:hypothetical protein
MFQLTGDPLIDLCLSIIGGVSAAALWYRLYRSGSSDDDGLATPEEVAADFYAARREGRDLKSHAQLIAERKARR